MKEFSKVGCFVLSQLRGRHNILREYLLLLLPSPQESIYADSYSRMLETTSTLG